MEDLTIGQRIAAKRKELGLSQIELGEKMGVSRQSVSKWEADAALPEIDKLIALSKLFHVSVGWLLGVEDPAQPEPSQEQPFGEQDWEYFEQTEEEPPRLPKWLLPLCAGAAAASLLAVLLSGAALYLNHRRTTQLAALSQSLAGLTLSIGGGFQDTELLQDYTLQAEPSADLKSCTFHFTGTPAFHAESSTAELLIVQGGALVLRQECRWSGTDYTAAFTLPVSGGYSAVFCLTDSLGMVRTSRVEDALLANIEQHCHPGSISVQWEKYTLQKGALTFENMTFHIEAPDIFRDSPDLWSRCDLVVLGDGRELGRTDILNRSPYSKAVNFGSKDVDFFTRAQTIVLQDTAGIDTLEVLLDCELTTGLQIRKVLKTLPAAAAR